MPSKPQSPEAAQNAVRRAEIQQLKKNRLKVARDFDKAVAAEVRNIAKAEKLLEKARRRYLLVQARTSKRKPVVLAAIDRRIGILNGRMQ